MFVKVVNARALIFGAVFFLFVFLMGVAWESASLGGLTDTFMFSR